MLTTLGSCGLASGVTELSGERVLPPAATGEATTDVERMERSNQRVIELLLSSPYRRPLSAANVMVSLLLLATVVQLIRRSGSTIWWVTQAALANGLLAVVETATQVWQLTTRWQEATGGGSQSGLTATLGVMPGLGMLLAMRLLVYGWILWRVRRPDIRAALGAVSPG